MQTFKRRLAPWKRGTPACQAWHMVLASIAMLTLLPAEAADSGWPARTIRLVSPIAPGGVLDIVPRMIAPRLSRELGQSIIVENRPGADTAIGVTLVARSPADGYTWLVGGTVMTTSPLLKPVQYDPIRDFAPVALVGTVSVVAVVPPVLGVRTLAEFVSLAKSRAGALNYGNSGVGSLVHMNTALFASEAGIDMTAIVYQGQAPALVDLIANRVNFMMVTPGVAVSHIRSGSLLPLGLVGESRSALLPAVPTMKELGYPSVNVETWVGMLMPAGTPREIVARANSAVNAAMKDAEVVAQLEKAGVTIAQANSPEEFARRMREEASRWPKVFEVAKIKREP